MNSIWASYLVAPGGSPATRSGLGAESQGWEFKEFLGLMAGGGALDWLAKSRVLVGTHQLAFGLLGWGRGLGEPILTILGPTTVRSSQGPQTSSHSQLS